MATSMVRGNRGSAQYELVFMATAPPLGYNTYFVRPATTNQQCVISTVTHPTTDTSISNKVCGYHGYNSNHMILTAIQCDGRWWEWSRKENNQSDVRNQCNVRSAVSMVLG